MKKNETRTARHTISRIVWGNIERHKYLAGVSDNQLCELLGVTSRTLLNYRKDPSNMTVKQLQAVIDSFGIEPEALFRS